jgi:uncharacterized protein YndB with AHSA1/START domain
MFKTILIVLAIAIVVFAIVVATRPATFRVERSITVDAPPEKVFALIDDLHQWEYWSPWARRDPAMKQIYEGPAAGVGASSHWQGNREVGEGVMTIIDSRPNELVRLRLEFLKPFQATHMAEFVLAPDGPRTRVTWSMSGENNFMAKAMHMFMDMDRMIGGDFEAGLAQIKAKAEAAR